MQIKVGIIGVGSISKQHIEAYVKNPDVELYAICDIVEERTREEAERYGVSRIYTDYNEMLKLEELDAVSVCTWNSAHAPCTIAALNAGKHVLCEKPMAISQKEASLMEEAAEKNGKLLMIGFVRRFGNDCKVMKEFIESGYLGEIYYAKATHLRRIGNPGGWFGDKAYSGGGPLIDLGVHDISLVKFLLGNPRPVSVYGKTYNKLGARGNIKGKTVYKSASASENDVFDVEDFVSAMISFENGAVLSIETSYSLNMGNEDDKIELFGTKGGAKLSPELEIYTEINDYLTDIKLDAETSFNFNGSFANEINHFVSCIKGEKCCVSPASDGVEVMKILDAIYESAKSGHEVIL